MEGFINIRLESLTGRDSAVLGGDMVLTANKGNRLFDDNDKPI